MKSGSLNLLEPSGPVQGCNGIPFYGPNKYRDADKSLARPGRKQANVSVRIA